LAENRIVEILSLNPIESPITLDEQEKGTELSFNTHGDSNGRITVKIPSGVSEGEIIVIKEGIFRVKVIRRDAFKVISKIPIFKKPMSKELKERIMENRENILAYVRAGIKEGWTDDAIIQSIMSKIG
jgi:hypothetical protein